MFGINTYIMWDPATLEAAIIDPGMIDIDEEQALYDFISRNSLRPVHLINTHMHLDHIFGNLKVKEKYGLDIKAHPDDDFLGKSLSESVRRFNLRIPVSDHGVDIALKDGETLYLGKEPVKVISVPGHSPGSIALYCPESGIVITGDALFRGSIGRTDLPGGNHATLIRSVTDRLLTLPDSTTVLPGHGPETTVGEEKRSNPYL
ncbi:MAG: MBL fold metallo-hydrolase [Duncaniella sp.]|nr:MBL fold metallo-hydrolase [Duncaniella sp.]